MKQSTADFKCKVDYEGGLAEMFGHSGRNIDELYDLPADFVGAYRAAYDAFMSLEEEYAALSDCEEG